MMMRVLDPRLCRPPSKDLRPPPLLLRDVMTRLLELPEKHDVGQSLNSVNSIIHPDE